MKDMALGAASVLVVLLVITALGWAGLSDDPESFGIIGTLLWLGAKLHPHKVIWK